MILFLCYIFPPLAVLLMGRPFSAFFNMFLTCFGWFPGVRHALVCYADRRVTKGVKQITNAINHPAWTRTSDAQSEGRVRGKRQQIPVYEIDNPHVGMHGTQFRLKN